MKETVKFAFIQTIPVLLGYLFMGGAFGLLLQQIGYGILWAFFISLFVYSGSMQYVLISFLSGGVSLISAAVMTLSVNSRHVFYGISFIEKFKSMGKRYLYMIHTLTDETYSLLCSAKVPKEMDDRDVYFCITAFNQLYWVTGCTMGNLLANLISFNTKGVDFAMTALFVVIFTEQWASTKNHLPAYIGIGSSIVCYFIFGANNFILPALLVSVASLIFFKNYLKSKEVA